jgi:hypothetical protein
MKQVTKDFQYETDLSEAIVGVTIEQEAGVIRNVVLLTGEKISRNKTFYTKKVMQEAITRYEGAKMFLDHPGPKEGDVRSVRDLGGVYKNVRLEEGRHLKADLHLLPNKDVRNLVIPIAEARIAGVGLSIRDRGKGRDENGVFLVEGFATKGPYSIDLVTEASVNENLFESTDGRSSDGGDDMKIEEIKLDELQSGNPTLVEAIRKQERDAVMKDLEAKLKKGDDAEKVILSLKKQKVLAEANLPKETAEKVSKLIDSETVSFELAESIVGSHKDLIAALPNGKREPKVNGHGGGREGDITESKLPTDEELIEAVVNAK